MDGSAILQTAPYSDAVPVTQMRGRTRMAHTAGKVAALCLRKYITNCLLHCTQFLCDGLSLLYVPPAVSRPRCTWILADNPAANMEKVTENAHHDSDSGRVPSDEEKVDQAAVPQPLDLPPDPDAHLSDEERAKIVGDLHLLPTCQRI